MKIGLASDHGGYKLKEVIKVYLKDKKEIELIDYGTDSMESVDYPDYGERAALGVKNGECDKAIVVCGTGIGISIAANKVRGIRCALCGDTFSAKMSRKHNNANMLALGERVTGQGLAIEILEAWLESDFEEGRHAKRVGKLLNIEESQNE